MAHPMEWRERRTPTYNHLLAALSSEDFAHLQPRLRLVKLGEEETIQRAGEVMGRVYFPVTAVLSLMHTLRNGSTNELGMVGCEGVSGLSTLLVDACAQFDTVVRIPGTAYHVPATLALHELRASGAMAMRLQHFVVAFQTQVSYRSSCSRHHTVLQRMASYLLMIRDRTGSGTVQLTHASLAQALGVGRPSVTLNIDPLQRKGILRLSRGSMTVLDSRALEALACECYSDICEEYDRLLGQLPLSETPWPAALAAGDVNR